jgi:hypothetical protein
MPKLLLFLLFTIIPVSSVYAIDDSFRCGNRIISTGDRKIHVLNTCGQPEYRDVRFERQIRRDFYRELLPRTEQERLREPLLAEETVEIEEWVYNFGPARLLRFLRFENGVLVDIETGDYGW